MKFLKTKWGKLAYTSRGNGSDIHLIFHGFGQSHEDMLPFESIIQSNQRFIFIDMFFHGRSVWRESDQLLSKSIWAKIVVELMAKEEFEEFHLIGYSMGGKFALLTCELFPSLVKSLTLLAPDGIKTGLFYSLSSYPARFNPVFRNVVFTPRRFFSVIDGLQQIGLLESSLVKFVKNEMRSRSKRAQVYLTWRVLSGIDPNLRLLVSEIRSRQIPVTLFLGKFDKMITEKNLSRFISKIPHIQTNVIPVGHGKLIEEAVKNMLEKR